MRVIFVNRFYWPEEPATAQLLTDLASALAALGHSVMVITSRPAHGGVARRETHAGVDVIRVRTPRWGRRNLPGRALDFLCFLVGANLSLVNLVRRGDLVVAMTDPPMLGLFVRAAIRLRRARLIHWVQDIFPEIASALSKGFVVHLLGRSLRPGRNRAWRSASGCVTLGKQMAAVLTEVGVAADRVTIIPNWAPSGLAPASQLAVQQLRESWALTGNFVVAYSGNLGRAHDFTAVLAVATELRSDPAIVFAFIGDGANRHELETAVTSGGLANVRFFPAQPRSVLPVTLSLGDLHLVTLRSGCESYVFPSKIYGIAAVGRPVLFIGDRSCEPARLVTDHAFGFAFAPTEVTAMADLIRQLSLDAAMRVTLGAAATQFSQNQGRIEHAVAAWHQLLEREGSCGEPISEPTL